MDLKDYLTKFDPGEKNDKFGLIREWIDREEFRKAIAEDPWKPKMAEKASAIDAEKGKTTIEEYVNDYSPKQNNYMNVAESEEFHVRSSITSQEPFIFQKPGLTTDSLIAVAVRNLDPENRNGASFKKIVAFITLHFPYFEMILNTCFKCIFYANLQQ